MPWTLIQTKNLEQKSNIEELVNRVAELEVQLMEANGLIDSIREGSIDAFVLEKDGQPKIYSLESIDYTYRILIEKFGEGALSISGEGLILYCNVYFSRLIGKPIAKIIGSYFQSLTSTPDEFKQLLDKLDSGPSKGEILLECEGAHIPVYVSLTSLQPHLPAIGMIVTDLTKNKEHEAQIYQYQKELEQKINELHTMNHDLEQFVHIISHDIKEPLRKIVSYGGRLHTELSGHANPGAIKNLGIIHDATMRLNLLVDDLVQYSSSSRDETKFMEVDLMRIVAAVLEDTELLIRERKAQISYSGLPKIWGSEVQMRQLFSNLIINAIKYSKKEETPQIVISTQLIDNPGTHQENQSYYKIVVSDNGIGIETQYLQKIFTIFQRLHNQSEYSGTGIGLAICKKIMENHEGRIEVKSEPGQGSEFYLYLPVI